jgi:holo-[acyl-carrier protein] synthase
MIHGIGVDIVQTGRIKELLEKSGGGALKKIFTEKEIRDSLKRADKFAFLAGRWAVKEAVSKAFGCGIGVGCSWKDVSVGNNKVGAPSISLKGNALKKSRKMGIGNIKISISHEKEYAVAFVILEGKI